MKIILGAFFTLAISMNAAAAKFEGEWSGALKFSVREGDYKKDSDLDCKFVFVNTGKYLFLEDDDGCLYTSGRYNIKNGDILDGDDVVGSITENSVTFTSEDGADKYSLKMVIESDGKLKVYESLTFPRRCGHTYLDYTEGTVDVATVKSQRTIRTQRYKDLKSVRAH